MPEIKYDLGQIEVIIFFLQIALAATHIQLKYEHLSFKSQKILHTFYMHEKSFKTFPKKYYRPYKSSILTSVQTRSRKKCKSKVT